MGAFLTADKSGYYWFLLGYMQDGNIYVRDTRLLPFTPGKPQTYVDFYPQLYTTPSPTKLTFAINGKQIASALLTASNGLVYADIPVPLGKFTLTTLWNGTVIRTEEYISKNFAMFMGVQAQSFSDRLTGLQAVAADQSFQTIRSDSLYPVIGAYFGFPPPPGWTPQQYREALLGGCGPGMLVAALMGTTQGAIVTAIEAVTCETPTIGPMFGGNRWVVRTRANSQPSNPAARGFYITSRADSDHVFVAPHYQAVMGSELWWSKASQVVVNGSVRVISAGNPDVMTKETNSFMQSGLAGPYPAIAGQTLAFSIEQVQDGAPADNTIICTTTFPAGTTTAAQVAAAICTQNPFITHPFDPIIPTYAFGNFLRLGLFPTANVVYRLTIIGGTALPALGFSIGQSVDIAPDQLANPWQTTNVTITDGVNTFVDGTDFYNIPSTGQIIWLPSSTLKPNVPPMGTTLYASYSYQMRREILKLVGDVQDTTDILYYSWM